MVLVPVNLAKTHSLVRSHGASVSHGYFGHAQVKIGRKLIFVLGIQSIKNTLSTVRLRYTNLSHHVVTAVANGLSIPAYFRYDVKHGHQLRH